MKVRIGPYPSRWSTQAIEQWYIKKRYKVESHFDVDDYPKDRLDRMVESGLNWWMDVLNATVNRFYFDKKVQKVSVKLDPWDTWSADVTLAYIIAPTLRQLREVKHGVPHIEVDDVPAELRPTEEFAVGTDEEFDELSKRWDWVISEMIWAFEQLTTDSDDQFHSGEMDITWNPVDIDGNPVAEEDAKLYAMGHGPNHTHKFDSEGWAKHQVRIQNGLRLFGKYYRALWD